MQACIHAGVTDAVFILERISQGETGCCLTWRCEVNGEPGPAGISYNEVGHVPACLRACLPACLRARMPGTCAHLGRRIFIFSCQRGQVDADGNPRSTKVSFGADGDRPARHRRPSLGGAPPATDDAGEGLTPSPPAGGAPTSGRRRRVGRVVMCVRGVPRK